MNRPRARRHRGRWMDCGLLKVCSPHSDVDLTRRVSARASGGVAGWLPIQADAECSCGIVPTHQFDAGELAVQAKAAFAIGCDYRWPRLAEPRSTYSPIREP